MYSDMRHPGEKRVLLLILQPYSILFNYSIEETWCQTMPIIKQQSKYIRSNLLKQEKLSIST